jgi:hypothetical protein
MPRQIPVRHPSATLDWGPDESATVIDPPLEDGALEWDAEEGATPQLEQAAHERGLQWVEMVRVSRRRIGRPPLRARPALEAGAPTTRSWPPVAAPLAHVEPAARPPLLTAKDWIGFGAGMLAASVLALVSALLATRAPRTVTLAAAPATTAVATTAVATTSPPTAVALPSVLEAVDAVAVRATATRAGMVRRAAARGSAVAIGDVLVELRGANPEAAQKLDELNQLLDEYEGAQDQTGAAARARAAYERAAASLAPVAVRAKSAGIIVGDPVRPGVTAEAGDELLRLAASVRLIVPAADVDGTGAACRVTLIDRPGVVLDARLVPGVPEAHSRTLALSSFPATLPLGTVGRVSAICR